MARATPAELNKHTHMITLSDGVTTLGFNAVDSQGRPNIRALRRAPYPKSTLQVNTGAGSYSERRLPYAEVSRDDWSGGMGIREADDDAMRYWFGSGIWTPAKGKMMRAPMIWDGVLTTPAGTTPLLQTIGAKAIDVGGSGSNYRNHRLYQATGYYEDIRIEFTPAYTFTPIAIRLNHVETIGDPTDVSISIQDTVGGLPICISNLVDQPLMGNDMICYFQYNQPLVGGTAYWLTIKSTDADVDDHYLLGALAADPAGITTTVYNGSNYVAVAGVKSILFNLIEDTEIDYAKVFRYKWALYSIVRAKDASTGRLYINGDRGCADSNAGNLDRLIDATKATIWTNDLYTGCTVRIYGGPGAGEERLIAATVVSGGTAYLVVSPPWATTHTTNTEYVISGAKNWTEVIPTLIGATSGIDKVEDVCVSNEGIVYFACGDTSPLVRFRAYNNAGTWTNQLCDDITTGTYPGASRLLFTYDQQYGASVWRAVNAGSGSISRANAVAWVSTVGTGLAFGTEVDIGGLEQDITDLVEYEGKIAVVKMDSIWMVLNNVPDKLSMDFAYKWEKTNGQNASVWTPYLVLPLSNQLHRIYNNMAESFGPEKDYAMPRAFNGIVSYTMSIVGGGIIGIDGGHINQRIGYRNSGVYLYRNGGWHPIGHVGKGSGMLSLFWDAQSVSFQDVLWIWTRSGPRWAYVPRSWDYTQDDYWDIYGFSKTAAPLQSKLILGGYVLTGNYDGGSLTLPKYWDILNLYGRFYASNPIKVYYRTSDLEPLSTDGYEVTDQSYWTYAGSTSTSSDTTEAEISLHVEAKKIQFLLVFSGIGDIGVQVLEGYNLQYLMRIESSNQYIIPTRASDYGFDRTGMAEGSGYDVTSVVNKLDEWSKEITPLTMRCVFDVYDNKRVILERTGLAPLWLRQDLTGGGAEAQLITLELLEV